MWGMYATALSNKGEAETQGLIHERYRSTPSLILVEQPPRSGGIRLVKQQREGVHDEVDDQVVSECGQHLLGVRGKLGESGTEVG